MPPARLAQPADQHAVMAILSKHPVESVAVGSWLQREGAHGLRSRRIWLHRDALCFAGANLIPVNADHDAARAFAERAAAEGRRCSSIVARLPAGRTLWEALEPSWGPARAVRHRQVVMISDNPPPVEPDPAVRFAVAADFEQLLAASIEMYVEEIGVSPVAHDGGYSYRWRVSELISERLAFVRTDGGQVVFKAEIGALTPECAQLQGVWVHPELRGRGIGTAGTAQVLRLARRRGVRRVSLAVNDFNAAALYSYERCGFRAVGDQLVVLF